MAVLTDVVSPSPTREQAAESDHVATAAVEVGGGRRHIESHTTVKLDGFLIGGCRDGAYELASCSCRSGEELLVEATSQSATVVVGTDCDVVGVGLVWITW
jgi:hypothetical protein